jgi:hypothetical protein
VTEGEAIAAGLAAYRKSIRPLLRFNAAILVLTAALVAYLTGLPLRRIVAAAGLAAVVLWFVLTWLERTWLPANLRERWRRSGASQ